MCLCVYVFILFFFIFIFFKILDVLHDHKLCWRKFCAKYGVCMIIYSPYRCLCVRFDYDSVYITLHCIAINIFRTFWFNVHGKQLTDKFFVFVFFFASLLLLHFYSVVVCWKRRKKNFEQISLLSNWTHWPSIYCINKRYMI